MHIWLRRLSSLYLPFLESFKQDVTLPFLQKPKCLHLHPHGDHCTVTETHAFFAQFMDMWPWLAFTFASASLYVQPRTLHMCYSRVHYWYQEPTFASHIHEPQCLFGAFLRSCGALFKENRWIKMWIVFFSWLQVTWPWEVSYSGCKLSFSTLWSYQRCRRRERASLYLF